MNDTHDPTLRSKVPAQAVTGRKTITRAGQGELADSPVGRYQYLASDLLCKQSLPILIEVTAKSLAEFGALQGHPGEELVYVLEGTLELHTDTYLPIRLQRGDSIYFDSNMAHAYVAVDTAPCRILSICVAPESQLADQIKQRK